MKKYFLTGLVILLPIALTIAVASFLINFFTDPFVELVSTSLRKVHFADQGFLFLTHDEMIRYLSRILILICLFFVTVLLGFLARLFLIRNLINLWDWALKKIPLVNTVYKTIQDITKILFKSNANAFKQVVLVPFLRKDIYTIGILAQDSPSICSESLGSPLVTVLIPSTPNPVSGYLMLYKKEDIIFLDMKTEEAIKYILSCGVIVPEERHLV